MSERPDIQEGASGTSPPGNKPECILRSVVSAFLAEPRLEAITINRVAERICVATTPGQIGDTALTYRIGRTIEDAHACPQANRCCLTADGNACGGCGVLLAQPAQPDIVFRREGDTTTFTRSQTACKPQGWQWRRIPWPKMAQRNLKLAESAGHPEEWKLRLLTAVLCGAFGLAAQFSGGLKIPLCLIAYAAGAWFAIPEIGKGLKKRTLDVHFLMLAVASGSAWIGAWGEGAMLLFLFSLSGALEHYAAGRTQREIHALYRESPRQATLLDAAGRESEMPVEQLAPGMRLLIRPGMQFPVDAEVIQGRTAVDESRLTGESVPVEKDMGDQVLAGTMNLWGAVEVTVLRPPGESALQRIIRLIQEAQHQKAPAQRFTDQFSTRYTYAVLGLSAAMFLLWWAAFDLPAFTPCDSRPSAFYRAMTLLVVASPCALVLSIPSAILAAIAWGARRGILFRGGAAVEKLAEISVVALDKTGTLTTGELQVETVESFPAGRETEVAELAGSLERLSAHPLARAITRYAKRERLGVLPLDDFESLPGLGLRARLRGDQVFLGKREWVAQRIGAPLPAHHRGEPGASEVWITRADLLGRVTLRDQVRPQAAAVIEQLRAAGLKTLLLTGDRAAVADRLKQILKVDELRADLKPQDKVDVIATLSQAGQRVAMVGDGVNDAPALAAAHAGVAMGARGSDAALEQADLVLMDDRLENFLTAFRLSRRARRIIRQNLFISLGTVALLVVLAAAGLISLTAGVVGHEGSTVVVVVNSLRLLLGSSDKPN